MCGIVGIYADQKTPFRVTEDRLCAMRDAMFLRGPDGGGCWISPDGLVGLGHRRLSIIDLSAAANQPMSNEDNSLWITFNGEIYNHAEIREELLQTGRHEWKTDHSDTEVILHSFEEWGIDCIHKFRGMFAFALWNAKSETLWLVRDRIGIKPLYYSMHHGRFSFASEIKALLKDPDQPREVNRSSLFDYFSFRTTPPPETLFKGIYKLPAGTWLKVRNGKIEKEYRYWDALRDATPLHNQTEDEIAARILSELKESVRLRKVSDVPVGVFLSGGVDSSANAILFSEGESHVKSFTIGYKGSYGSYQNETHYAKKMANYAGTEHHELLLTQDDLISFLPEMVRLQDEPIADPVCVPVYYVSKLAKENGVTVCHVGEGADELFCGYPGWKKLLAIQQWCDRRVPSSFWRVAASALVLGGKGASLPREWMRRAGNGGPVFWGGEEAFSDAGKRNVLSPSMRAEFRDATSWSAISAVYSDFRERAEEPSALNWMTYLDLNFRLPELLLMRVDKMSMGVSLEGRVPFLDHKLVELVMGIPSSMKLRDGQLKYMLKKALKGTVPDEILNRPKQGFGVPVYEWIMDRLGAHARIELESFCRETDYIDIDAVHRLFEKRRGKDIWYLLNFALWWKHYIAGEEIAR